MKRYYVLEKSLQGIYPQAECNSVDDANVADLFRHYIDTVDPKSLNLLFTLRYHAKLTDVLTTIPSGSFSFLLSDKLRRIFEVSRLTRHIFFDAILIKKDKTPLKYNWLNFMRDESLLDCIDYEKSIFREQEWGITDKELIKVNSYAHYQSLAASSPKPIAFNVKLEKIVMKDDFDRSLDMFFLAPFDYNIYVSEELKDKMEEAKITGVCFTDPIMI